MLARPAPDRDRAPTPVRPTDDPLRALVGRLSADLAAVCERVAVLERAARVHADDDVALMAALVAAVGACVFSAAEILDHATIDRDLHAALRSRRTAKAVGLRLRGIADQPLGGFVLRRVGRDEHGILWGLQVASDLHPGPCPGEDPG